MNNLKLLLIGCLIILLVLANLAEACDKNVEFIKAGTVVKCDTWIVKEDTMQEMARTVDKLELSQKLVEQQKTLLKLSNEEIEHYKVQSQSRASELNKAESKQFWTGIGGFALGVVLTGIAAKAAIEATR